MLFFYKIKKFKSHESHGERFLSLHERTHTKRQQQKLKTEQKDSALMVGPE